MGLRRLGRRTWSLGSMFPFPIHVFLVEAGGSLSLVDAGIPPMAGAILRAIRSIGLPLAQVVLTHGHGDHVGALPAVLAAHPVPVRAHPEEIPFLVGARRYTDLLRRSGVPVRAAPAKPIVAPQSLQPLAPGEAPGGLQPHHTPGHSPGHTAYWVPDEGLLIAGDLFTAFRPGRLGRPMPFFTPDMPQAIRSGAVVEDLRPQRMAVCHGGVIANPHLQYPAYRRRYLRGLGSTAAG